MHGGGLPEEAVPGSTMADVTTPDGVRLHVEDQGEGPAVVLVHGWCGSTKVWDPIVPALAQRRRVIRYDQRGCGSSQSKEDTNDLDHYASDLAFVLEHLNVERAVAVGWSLGVGTIHRYLQTHGARHVSGVVLVDYPVKLDEGRDVADKVCHQLNKRRNEFLASFVDRMVQGDNPAVRDLLLREALRVTRTVACEMYRAMGQAPAPVEETFDVPALLVFPTGGWFPNAVADWRQRFPEHEVRDFPKSRHAPVLEEGDAFVEAVLEFSEPTGRLSLSSV